MLAVSSLSAYGILLAGWSANSKYAFLGSLRSTAQLISYELILSSAILIVILLTGSLNLTINVEAQKAVFFALPVLPLFIIFFIGCIAETNRAPFDLAEAESELVSGFMTEHSAVIFVSPKFVIVELFKHSPKIQNASKLTADEVLELLSIIINKVRFYDEDLVSLGSWTEAFRLCREIDLKDTPYIALALELNAKVWTKDDVLKKGLEKKVFIDFYEI